MRRQLSADLRGRKFPRFPDPAGAALCAARLPTRAVPGEREECQGPPLTIGLNSATNALSSQ